MSAIEIKRPVAIKVVMTSDFRKQLIAEAQETIRQINDNLKHMETESQKQISALEITNPQQASLLMQQLDSEKEKLMRVKSELDWRIREVEGIQEGAEVPFRMFEGSVNINLGDNFLEKMSQAEVVIKDWLVIEIRQK
jgi:hypothetical protein